ncbi:ankyrin repeat-containing domain protein [Aspergillus unguis]
MDSSLGRLLFELVLASALVQSICLIRRACNYYVYTHWAPALLIFAAKQGSTWITRNLLDGGADVRWQSDDRGNGISYNTSSKEHPISYAAALGHVAITELLLEHGADIEYKGREGRTPLLLAARNNQIPVARLLISRGADILAEDMSQTSSIKVSLSKGFDEMLAMLLASFQRVPFSPEYIQKGIQEVLLAAAVGRRLEWVQYAISRGADINYQRNQHSRTALLVAAGRADPATVQLLLKNGADPNIQRPQNPRLRRARITETPILQAARNTEHSAAILRLLLDHGAIPHGPDDYRALLHLIENGDVLSFRLLVDHGVPLKHKLTRVPTLIRRALMSGQSAIVDILLEMGVTPTERDLEIVRNNRPERLGMLQPAGADYHPANDPCRLNISRSILVQLQTTTGE